MSSTAAGVTVRIEHMRAAGLCVAGVRTWFAHNDLDFRDFLDNGIPAERLQATGDPLAQRAVDEAVKQTAQTKDTSHG